MTEIRRPRVEGESFMLKKDAHLTILEGGPGLSAEAVLRDISHMVRDALQARVTLVREIGSGVEFETQQVLARLTLDGINADLSAIRVGEYFKTFTEFNLLQRLNKAIMSRVDGKKIQDNLNSTEDGV